MRVVEIGNEVYSCVAGNRNFAISQFRNFGFAPYVGNWGDFWVRAQTRNLIGADTDGGLTNLVTPHGRLANATKVEKAIMLHSIGN